MKVWVLTVLGSFVSVLMNTIFVAETPHAIVVAENPFVVSHVKVCTAIVNSEGNSILRLFTLSAKALFFEIMINVYAEGTPPLYATGLRVP